MCSWMPSLPLPRRLRRVDRPEEEEEDRSIDNTHKAVRVNVEAQICVRQVYRSRVQ